MKNSKKADDIFINVFSSIALERRNQKHFLVYIKVKEKLYDIDKCSLESYRNLNVSTGNPHFS